MPEGGEDAGASRGEDVGGRERVPGGRRRVRVRSFPFQSLAPTSPLRLGRRGRDKKKMPGLQLYTEAFLKQLELQRKVTEKGEKTKDY